VLCLGAIAERGICSLPAVGAGIIPGTGSGQRRPEPRRRAIEREREREQEEEELAVVLLALEAMEIFD
jgi:hypothetical protein